MSKKEKNQTIVRCTDANCRSEFEGKSIPDILSNARCGRDGGPLKDSCRACLKSDGNNLFKLVPVDSRSKKKDNDKKDTEVSEE